MMKTAKFKDLSAQEQCQVIIVCVVRCLKGAVFYKQ